MFHNFEESEQHRLKAKATKGMQKKWMQLSYCTTYIWLLNHKDCSDFHNFGTGCDEAESCFGDKSGMWAAMKCLDVIWSHKYVTDLKMIGVASPQAYNENKVETNKK